MEKLTITLHALEGDRVNVLNYLKRPARWEPGEVLDVETKIWKDKRTSNTYRIKLDRLSTSGNMIFVHVGDDKIDRI